MTYTTIEMQKVHSLRNRYKKLMGELTHSVSSVVGHDDLKKWFTSNFVLPKELVAVKYIKKSWCLDVEKIADCIFTLDKLDCDEQLNKLRDFLLNFREEIPAVLSGVAEQAAEGQRDIGQDVKELRKKKADLEKLNSFYADESIINNFNSMLRNLEELMDKAEYVSNILSFRHNFPDQDKLTSVYHKMGDSDNEEHDQYHVPSRGQDVVKILSDVLGIYKIGASERSLDFKKDKEGSFIVTCDNSHVSNSQELAQGLLSLAGSLCCIAAFIGGGPIVLLSLFSGFALLGKAAMERSDSKMKVQLDQMRFLCHQGLYKIILPTNKDGDIVFSHEQLLDKKQDFLIAALNMQYDIKKVQTDPTCMANDQLEANQYVAYNNNLYYVDCSKTVHNLNGKCNLSCEDWDDKDRLLFRDFNDYSKFKDIVKKSYSNNFPSQPKIEINKKMEAEFFRKDHAKLKGLYDAVRDASKHGPRRAYNSETQSVEFEMLPHHTNKP